MYIFQKVEHEYQKYNIGDTFKQTKKKTAKKYEVQPRKNSVSAQE
jgi:hypothetical protein